MLVPAFLTHACLGAPYGWSAVTSALTREQGVVVSAASDWGLDLATYPMTIMIGPAFQHKITPHDPTCSKTTLASTMCQEEEVWLRLLLASGQPGWGQGDARGRFRTSPYQPPRRAMVQGTLIASIGFVSAGVTIIFARNILQAGKHHASQPACPLCLHRFDCTGEWVGVHASCSDNH